MRVGTIGERGGRPARASHRGVGGLPVRPTPIPTYPHPLTNTIRCPNPSSSGSGNGPGLRVPLPCPVFRHTAQPPLPLASALCRPVGSTPSLPIGANPSSYPLLLPPSPWSLRPIPLPLPSSPGESAASMHDALARPDRTVGGVGGHRVRACRTSSGRRRGSCPSQSHHPTQSHHLSQSHHPSSSHRPSLPLSHSGSFFAGVHPSRAR